MCCCYCVRSLNTSSAVCSSLTGKKRTDHLFTASYAYYLKVVCHIKCDTTTNHLWKTHSTVATMSSVYDQDQRSPFTGKWKVFKTLLVSSVAANTLNLTLWFQFKSSARHILIYLPPASRLH